MTFQSTFELIEEARAQRASVAPTGGSDPTSGAFSLDVGAHAAGSLGRARRSSAPSEATRITWTRVGDLVVVALSGRSFVPEREFEPLLAALYELPPRKVLLGAFGSPAFDAEQRRRFHAMAASFDLAIALVFDGSLVTRSVGIAMSRSLPKLAIFRAEEVELALDHLSVSDVEREEALDAFRLLAFGAR